MPPRLSKDNAPVDVMAQHCLDPRLAKGHHTRMQIYKIFRAAEWAALSELGTTAGAPVDIADGFIHFSTAAQVQETLDKHFTGETGLVLLACESDAMGDSLKWEKSRGDELFPHLYRGLSLGDVIWNRPINSDGGTHTLPDGVI